MFRYLVNSELISLKMENMAQIYLSPLHTGHAHLLCIVPISVHVLTNQALKVNKPLEEIP